MEVLSAWDYVTLFVTLAISAGIGMIVAYRSGRRQSSADYLIGGRSMPILPVAVSMSGTLISAITYLGTPAEVYVHGPKYGLIAVVRLFAACVLSRCVIPVFYGLQLTTVYEYLALRFDNNVRFIVIASEFLSGFIFLGVVVYTPALVLSTVTGLSLTLSILAIGVVGTFYTSVGGIKAVVWTDVYQVSLMVTGALLMVVVGTISIGGPSEGWLRAAEGDRTVLIDFDLNPAVRVTVWSMFIGGSSLTIMLVGTKQTFVQRYISCESEHGAHLSMWLGLIITGLAELLVVAVGMTLYAYYSSCDPLTDGKINRPDQIVPFYMVDLFHSYPGVPGFLIAGAFCSSLSAMSAVLTATVAMTGHDIIKTIWPNMSDNKYSIIIKVISFLYGGITIMLAFLASILGEILETVLSIAGLAGGPIFGVFILGMFTKNGNSKGAIAGMGGGTSIGVIYYVGQQIFLSEQRGLSFSIVACNSTVADNSSLITSSWFYTDVVSATTSDGLTVPPYSQSIPNKESPLSDLFSLSFLYMTTLTTAVSLALGLVVSFMTSRARSATVDHRLLAPVSRRFCKQISQENNSNDKLPGTKEYITLESADKTCSVRL